MVKVMQMVATYLVRCRPESCQAASDEHQVEVLGLEGKRQVAGLDPEDKHLAASGEHQVVEDDHLDLEVVRELLTVDHLVQLVAVHWDERLVADRLVVRQVLMAVRDTRPAVVLVLVDMLPVVASVSLPVVVQSVVHPVREADLSS